MVPFLVRDLFYPLSPRIGPDGVYQKVDLLPPGNNLPHEPVDVLPQKQVSRYKEQPLLSRGLGTALDVGRAALMNRDRDRGPL
jgi:hypothetical protein